ncbi:MAG TPA: DUF6471 domain-containing protein [Rubrivivax sp.]|nr:DUF6471 domain-containing protein [Rubrivivax sp.]
MNDWTTESKRLLRSELVRRGYTYHQLAEALAGIGLPETERSVANKMSRGSFSFAFFLQCMAAMGRPSVDLDLTGARALAEKGSNLRADGEEGA